MYDCLRQAVAGRGQLLLVSGDPGIGKTRLAEEAANVATSNGAKVLWGRCWESGGAPAFWPWIQIVRECIGGSDKIQPPELGPAASLFGALDTVPSGVDAALRDRHPADLPVYSAPAAEGEEPLRFRMFDSVSGFLRRTSQVTPLVILLDDLHAADVDSLLLLRFIARDLHESRMLIVGTYRQIEAGLSSQHAELLNQIAREGHVIRLRGLAEADVAEFIKRNASFAPEPGVVAALYRATEGNPFFLDEIVRSVPAERSTKAIEVRIPEGIRTVIRRRLAPLSREIRRVLDIAAVGGPTIEIPVLQRITQIPLPELLGILDQACTFGLLVRQEPAPIRYSFAHSMIPETIRDELPKPYLLDLHRSIAETLEGFHGSAPGPHLHEIAHHYLLALPTLPVEKAIEYAERGAEYALKQLAYEEAARLYKSALDHLTPGPHANDRQRCELLLALGEAQIKNGNSLEARENFRCAGDLAGKIGRPDLLGRAALGAAFHGPAPGTTDRACVALLEEALAAVDAEDSVLRALLLASLANHLRWSDRSAMTKSFSQKAVEVARRVKDAAALASALWNKHASVWSADNVLERLAAASEIVRLSERAGNIDWALRGRDLRIVALLELGDISEVDQALDAYARLAEDMRLSLTRPKTLSATRATMNAEPQEAERLAYEALQTAERRQEPGALMSYEAQIALLRTGQARLAECEPTLKQRVSQFPTLVVIRCGLAACYTYVGQKELAKAEFEFIAANDFTRIQRDWNWLAAISMSAHVCAYLGDSARAATLYELLKPYGERNVTVGWGEACYGSADHFLGLLAATLPNFERAEQHFEAALKFNFAMGATALVAPTQCDYAEMLIKRGAPGDRKRAGELAAAALAMIEGRGIAGVENHARRIMESLPAEATPSEKARAPITPAVSSPSARYVFRREGDFWTIVYERELFRLKDAKGLAYIAYLLQHPGQEIQATFLASAIALESAGQGSFPEKDKTEFENATIEQLQQLNLHRGDLGDAGEMLDNDAKTAYGLRISELREEIEEAREKGHYDRVAKAEEEIDAIAHELRRGVGLHGRDRKASSNSERARLNVTRAIKVAIDRIEEEHPAFASHLRSTIRTGTSCWYRVEAGAPAWEF